MEIRTKLTVQNVIQERLTPARTMDIQILSRPVKPVSKQTLQPLPVQKML